MSISERISSLDQAKIYVSQISLTAENKSLSSEVKMERLKRAEGRITAAVTKALSASAQHEPLPKIYASFLEQCAELTKAVNEYQDGDASKVAQLAQNMVPQLTAIRTHLSTSATPKEEKTSDT